MSANEGPKLNVDDLLFFPGKELNETNIAGRRSPPQPIRLAIGRHGVYKFEREQDKVLAFWGFKELSDWSFSGYSFTLNFINKKVYHLRTDDGQAISHWIESFSRNPDQAAIAAKQFRSLGTNTMRKFTAELRPISYQAKFYTLNPRRSKPQSIDSSRMLSAYGVDKNKTLPQTQRQKSPLKSSENNQLRWSNTAIGPPEAVKLKESSGSSSEGYLTASLELGEHEGGGAMGSGRDSSTQVRAQSMDSLFNGTSSSPSQSVNHAPSEEALPIAIPPPLSGRDIKPPSILKKAGLDESETPPIIPPRASSLPQVIGHEYSTLEEPVPPVASNVLIKVNEDELEKKPGARVPRPHMYEQIEIFPSKSPPTSPPLRGGDRLGVREGGREGTSGEYDHLFPVKKTHKNALRKKKNEEGGKEGEKGETGEEKPSDNGVVHSPLRRNESLPPMVFHSPLVVRRRKTDEEDEDEEDQSLSDNTEEDDEAPSPLPSVVYRSKKDSSSSDDPFADFFSGKSHLRWSQDLNPIYDNIKGMKISPAVAYEASSLLAKRDQAIPEEDDTGSSGRAGGERESISSSGSGVETLVLVSDVPQSRTLSPPKRRPHNYEEVTIGGPPKGGAEDRSRLGSKGTRPLSDHYQTLKDVKEGIMRDPSSYDDKSATLASPVRRLRSADTSQFISPRLNKRVINRRSKTVRSNDDFNAPHGRQHAQKVADTMKDFSFTNREYRVFYIKLPNGQMTSEVVNINRPVAILINKMMELLGVCSSESIDNWSVYVEGAILTTMKEAVLEFGEVQPAKAHVDRSVSLTQLVDSNSLADQGGVPLLLKNSLSFRMQGITTSRILRLDDGDDSFARYKSIPVSNEFHKKWLSVVQGNQPCTLESAVKLAAIQYQAYFLDRTVENSVVGFCRPNDFLPAEFAGMRGIEQKMYKEQEKIKSRNQSDIQKFYIKYSCSLPTNDTVFFPVREPRRKLFQSTRLKPVLLGVNKNGIMRVCPKTKEVLDNWEYQVLKNWAYSKRSFVVAFNDKSYAVESNQARWISELVDFFVDSIVHSSPPPS